MIGERNRIDITRQVTAQRQRLQFGGEQKSLIEHGVIEQLHAKMIAREKQPLLNRIPDGKGKNTMQPIKACGLITDIKCQQHFGITAGPQSDTGPLQLIPQAAIIINLTVETDGVAAVGRRHGLMRSVRQIDNRQPRVTQRETGGFVEMTAFIVRAAMA